MIRHWLLPFFLLSFASMSVLILRSVAPALLSKQLFFFLGGTAIFMASSRIEFKRWAGLGPYLYGVLLILLALTQIIGKVTRGAVSWIPLGPIHVEPSQLAVFCVGLVVSKFVVKHPLQNLQSFFTFALLVIVPAMFIFFQPDFGSTAIYLTAMASVFLLSNTKPAFLFGTAGVVVISSILIWTVLLKPYQKQRVTSFLNVSEQASAASYNAIQSVIAVGSGQLFGRGLGQGVQSHLRFLPERQTDFVFASFAEETGLLGSSLILGLYIATVCFVFFAGAQSSSESERLFCILTATMLAVQSTINIGMNIGLLPITGVTLPFISYGGSSILSLALQFGCIQSILLRQQKKASLHLH